MGFTEGCIRFIPGVVFDRACISNSKGSYYWTEDLKKVNHQERIADRFQLLNLEIPNQFVMPVEEFKGYSWEVETPYLLIDYLVSDDQELFSDTFKQAGESLALLHATTVDSESLPLRRMPLICNTPEYAKVEYLLMEYGCSHSCPISLDNPCLIHGRFSASMIVLHDRKLEILVSYDLGYGSPLLDLSHLIFELWELSFLPGGRNKSRDARFLRYANDFLSAYREKSGTYISGIQLQEACFWRACLHGAMAALTQRKEKDYAMHVQAARKNITFFDLLDK